MTSPRNRAGHQPAPAPDRRPVTVPRCGLRRWRPAGRKRFCGPNRGSHRTHRCPSPAGGRSGRTRHLRAREEPEKSRRSPRDDHRGLLRRIQGHLRQHTGVEHARRGLRRVPQHRLHHFHLHPRRQCHGRRAVAQVVQPALMRHQALAARSAGGLHWSNQVWMQAGVPVPEEPHVAAEMDQARADHRWHRSQTIFGYLDAFFAADPWDIAVRTMYWPFVTLYLQWETLYPGDWCSPDSNLWSPWTCMGVCASSAGSVRGARGGGARGR